MNFHFSGILTWQNPYVRSVHWKRFDWILQNGEVHILLPFSFLWYELCWCFVRVACYLMIKGDRLTTHHGSERSLLDWDLLACLAVLWKHLSLWYCSECAVSIWVSSKFSSLYCIVKTSWKNHGTWSPSWWASFSWLSGAWSCLDFLSSLVLFDLIKLFIRCSLLPLRTSAGFFCIKSNYLLSKKIKKLVHHGWMKYPFPTRLMHACFTLKSLTWSTIEPNMASSPPHCFFMAQFVVKMFVLFFSFLSIIFMMQTNLSKVAAQCILLSSWNRTLISNSICYFLLFSQWRWRTKRRIWIKERLDFLFHFLDFLESKGKDHIQAHL